MTKEEAITYFEGTKKRLEDFRKIYPSPNTIGYQATTKEISFYDMAISALSENKGEWIPVSERLPEIHQDVLLELRSGEMLTGFKAETEPYFYCHGVDGCYIEPQNVLAWQPLPEPYKAEKGGE